MNQYSVEGTGAPETRTGPRPRPSKPLPFTLRIAEQPAPVAGAPAMLSSREVADYMTPLVALADREAFVVLHLDVKNQLLDVELQGLGDVDSSAVYPRQVFRSALLRNASALIFCHNHPSGDPEPSLCDRQLTRDLVLGARAVGLKVLDHIILGRNRYFSMADQGLIDDYAMTAALGVRDAPALRVGTSVRVRPFSDIGELVGLPGVVVAFVAGPTDGAAWPLVAFDEPHAFPSGVETHSGNGLESRPVPAEHRDKCWYFNPEDLEIVRPPREVREDGEPYGYDYEPIDGVGFADPGGRSALRAATKRNPRNLPCPTCGEKNRLTPLDRARGYHCDACADRAEGRGY